MKAQNLAQGARFANEIRVDPLTGLKTIVAGGRAERAGAWPVASADAGVVEAAGDPFAVGNEAQTPPEVDADRPDGSAADGPGWRVRAVPNKYPALVADAVDPERSHAVELFSAVGARGAHEVIVNAPEGVTSLGSLSVEQVGRAMAMWRARMRAHAGRAAYVHLLVNERAEGGASLPHTHAQLYALDFVPAQVARERERFGAYAVQTMGGNLLENLVAEEVRQRVRMVAIDDEVVTLSPYAARFPFQMLLAPRRPVARFEDASYAGAFGAAAVHDALARLRGVLGFLPPLNLWVRTAPAGAEHFCWRIDVVPRLTHLAGLELGTGVGLNIVAPEDAARQLRDAA
jgi:UDPglucose--hexose-1-phosphate uridylyltransferase